MSTQAKIRAVLDQIGASPDAFIPLQTPLSFQAYQDWIAQGMHGDMDYLAKNLPTAKDPQSAFPEVQSLIVFTEDYFPHPSEHQVFASLKVAHYARNQDYHHWFREKLNQKIQLLSEAFPDEVFLAFTDSVPLLERDYAFQAGLGWVGKNTCLIHPKKGSLFFIGEILTSLKAHEPSQPMADFCGKCTACLDVCPTDAFVAPKVLDANRCIAYWTIESRQVPPEELRLKVGDWFFGCDLCQTVCPWNIKLHKQQEGFIESEPSREALIHDLKHVLLSSNKKLLREVKDTPLMRAGGRGLKRNALLMIASRGLSELSDEVRAFCDHPDLGELAQWTIAQLKAT